MYISSFDNNISLGSITDYEFYSNEGNILFTGKITKTNDDSTYMTQNSIVEFDIAIPSNMETVSYKNTTIQNKLMTRTFDTKMIFDFNDKNLSLVSYVSSSECYGLKIYAPRGVARIIFRDMNGSTALDLQCQIDSIGESNKANNSLYYENGGDIGWNHIHYLDGILDNESYNFNEYDFDRIITILNSDNDNNRLNKSELDFHVSRLNQHSEMFSIILNDITKFNPDSVRYTNYDDLKMRFGATIFPISRINEIARSKNGEFNCGLVNLEDGSKFYVGNRTQYNIIDSNLVDTHTDSLGTYKYIDIKVTQDNIDNNGYVRFPSETSPHEFTYINDIELIVPKTGVPEVINSRNDSSGQKRYVNGTIANTFTIQSYKKISENRYIWQNINNYINIPKEVSSPKSGSKRYTLGTLTDTITIQEYKSNKWSDINGYINISNLYPPNYKDNQLVEIDGEKYDSLTYYLKQLKNRKLLRYYEEKIGNVYVSGTIYNKGDIIFYTNYLKITSYYKSNKDRNVDPLSNKDSWTQIDTCDKFDINKEYEKDDVYYRGRILYKYVKESISIETGTDTVIGTEYNSDIEYNEGSIVFLNNKYYESKVNDNQGVSPINNSSFWRYLGKCSEYVNGNYYEYDSVYYVSNKLYRHDKIELIKTDYISGPNSNTILGRVRNRVPFKIKLNGPIIDREDLNFTIRLKGITYNSEEYIDNASH